MSRRVLFACFAQMLVIVTNNTIQAEDRPPTPPPAPQVNYNFQQPPPSSPPTASPDNIQHDKFINGMPVITPSRSLNTSKAPSAAGTSQQVGQIDVKMKKKEIRPDTKSIHQKTSNQNLKPNPSVLEKSVNTLPPQKNKVIKKPVIPEQK